MEINFSVVGKRPAISAESNRFLKALDLGVNGAFVRFSSRVTVNALPDANIKRICAAIRLAYKSKGCVDVKVEQVD